MNRRLFFQTLLGAGIAAHELDVEKLVWTPGKLISIPAPQTLRNLADAHNFYRDPNLQSIIEQLVRTNEILDDLEWATVWNPRSISSPSGFSS